jgi:transposase
MKKISRATTGKDKPEITVGLDLGDRFSHYCMLNSDGDAIETGRMQTTEAALRRHFEAEPALRIALECGTHSPWISRLLEQWGHQVIVANARKIRAISASESKNDKNDAEKLARFALCDPRLLSPIRHRSPERQQDLNLLQARSTLVRARTMIVNALRGLVKSAGGRLPVCSTQSIEAQAQAAIPPALAGPARPLLNQIAALSASIREMDRSIEQLGNRYAEIKLLRTPPRRRPADRRRLRAHAGPAGHDPTQPSGRCVSGPAPAAEPVRRLGPAAPHQQNRQRLSAQPAGAGGTLHTGSLRSRLRAAPLGLEVGRLGRQARKETSHRRRSPQTGRHPASHLANRKSLASLPAIRTELRGQERLRGLSHADPPQEKELLPNGTVKLAFGRLRPRSWPQRPLLR